MPLTTRRLDAHLNRLQGHRRQPIARSGKFVRRAYSRRALDCACAFSHRARCTKTTLNNRVLRLPAIVLLNTKPIAGRRRALLLNVKPARMSVKRQRCWKRGSGDGQRLSLYDYGTTERSFNAVERWVSTLTWTVCTAADSEERQICTTCLFAEDVGLWKDDGLAFSHRGAHFCLRGGWGIGS